jgi:uncharacterized damage-inducible protein DinB
MQGDNTPLTTFYEGWPEYQRLLVEAVAPLSAEQFALRAAPSLRPLWLLAAHIIGTRVAWFHLLMKEGDPALAVYDPWDWDNAPPRSAAELVEGLEATWAMVWGCLERWTPAMLEDAFTTRRGRRRTRGWVVWHILEHDLHHGGELSLTLGIHGLPALDL